MASTPSLPSSSNQLWNYDVYLSFRGEDIRRNFADHLYTALHHQPDILTYKEDETLFHGEPLGESLLKAIEESRIVVVIFSKTYARSSWCLNELVHIMKCKDERGQTVLPIFYHMKPLDVKIQKGAFEEAFANYELRNNDKIKLWREALASVCNLPTCEQIEINPDSNESTCIKQIVDTIMKTLSSNKVLIEARTPSQDPWGGSKKCHQLYVPARQIGIFLKRVKFFD